MIRTYRAQHLIVALACCLLVGANTGCISRAIREAAGAATGASGVVVAIRPIPPGALAEFGSYTFDELTSDVGGLASRELIDTIRRETRFMIRQRELLKSGDRQLDISGEIIHFERSDGLDIAIGPLEQVIARITLRDAETKDVIGVANVIGRAKALSNAGDENLGQGCAKGIAAWIEQNVPTRGSAPTASRE